MWQKCGEIYNRKMLISLPMHGCSAHSHKNLEISNNKISKNKLSKVPRWWSISATIISQLQPTNEMMDNPWCHKKWNTMTDCLELYIKHRPIFMTICNREHLSKISKSLNCVKFRKHSVRNKATRNSFCHFVNSIAYINTALIPTE